MQIQASKRISYSQSNMGRSEKDALLGAAGDGEFGEEKGSTSSFFFSNQAPSVLTESLLHSKHTIVEDVRGGTERDSEFSSKADDEEDRDT